MGTSGDTEADEEAASSGDGGDSSDGEVTSAAEMAKVTEIAVTIGKQTKWISGLTETTTCNVRT